MSHHIKIGNVYAVNRAVFVVLSVTSTSVMVINVRTSTVTVRQRDHINEAWNLIGTAYIPKKEAI
ncbi:hypothetical protein [Klebsiella phage KP8]|uniref:Uncharacterized protein n=1 Tax=Klebsiella phage KP8 TaxID=2099850 RepID=A0A2P1CCR0_9CAUD|nr:hypothetical protein HWB55_gp066 [Klebsiella phage KP8]AVJ49003.1 hypothetical protein [Klebsiella phage KP8]